MECFNMERNITLETFKMERWMAMVSGKIKKGRNISGNGKQIKLMAMVSMLPRKVITKVNLLAFKKMVTEYKISITETHIKVIIFMENQMATGNIFG